ncbi:MAG: cysteine desulfurase [Bacteroidia bacterium]|nr:cysteine desulfurase [Bacteroidia bacterium]
MKTQIKFDSDAVRKDFPLLHNIPNITYLDNAATTHKPQTVIDAVEHFYTNENANIHRAVHALGQEATRKFEEARTTVAHFINAKQSNEIIFTRGATEGINLVAFAFGELLQSGDEILLSDMEHHSNIVPWQILCKRKGCLLKVIPVNRQGEIVEKDFEKLLNYKTRLVALTHVSNTLGTINPIKNLIAKAHEYGAKVLIDGAQSIQHLPVDMQDLDCDFFVFSGHKVFGPTGIGVLYGKETLLEQMPPYQGGGEMIEHVTWSKTTYNVLPYKFEAGTPHIAGAFGLAEALNYLARFNRAELIDYENHLLSYAQNRLLQIKGLEIIGNAAQKASIISFNIKGVHPYDLGVLLDKQGIAVRTGHHCTQPLMDLYQIPGTVRASFVFYNSTEEIDRLVEAVRQGREMLL